jgi:hypothetical protein
MLIFLNSFFFLSSFHSAMYDNNVENMYIDEYHERYTNISVFLEQVGVQRHDSHRYQESRLFNRETLHPTGRSCSQSPDSPLRLQGDAGPRAVLDEDTAVDLAFIQPTRLETRVDHVTSAGGLLENANLVLALARVVVGNGTSLLSERITPLGIVDL